MVADVAIAMGSFSAVAFVDDSPDAVVSAINACRIIGSADELIRAKGAGYTHFHVSIGSNEARARCFNAALTSGLVPATLVHPSAVISPSARIGSGTVVMAAAVINANARIGDNCIVNTAAVIEHDCQIGNHVHISSGAVLAGGIDVGPFAQIGAGAVVLPGAKVGEGATVGAGAVVLRLVADWATVVGVPAKQIRAKLPMSLSQQESLS